MEPDFFCEGGEGGGQRGGAFIITVNYHIDVCNICAAAKISISDAQTVSTSILDLFKY